MDSTPQDGERKSPPWPNPPTKEICVDECGSKCCRTSSLYLELTPEEEKLFKGYRLRNEMTIQDGKVIRKIKKLGGSFLWFQDTNGRCPHLDWQGLCKIYEDRPNACRVFPHEPVPGCLVWPAIWPKALAPLPPPDGVEVELPFKILRD